MLLFAVAILMNFDNENKVLFVEAETKEEAIVKGVAKFEKQQDKDYDTGWIDAQLVDKSYEEQLDVLYDHEMCVCVEPVPELVEENDTIVGE